jgi:hypothetical protein
VTGDLGKTFLSWNSRKLFMQDPVPDKATYRQT